MSATELLSRLDQENFDTLPWYQKKILVNEILGEFWQGGYRPRAQLEAWFEARWSFSLPDVARFVAASGRADYDALYVYVSRTYMNSFFNTDSDSIRSIIQSLITQPGDLPDIFWMYMVDDLHEHTLARIGDLIPSPHVGTALVRLFSYARAKEWGGPYLNLFYLYLAQRTDEFAVMPRSYLEALYDPAGSL